MRETVKALASRTTEMGKLTGLIHTAGLSPTMANWIWRLMQCAASYITGTDILVDGGTIANMARMQRNLQRKR